MARVLIRPRTCCVYCGARTDEPDPVSAYNGGKTYRRRHPLACWRHRSLVTRDPYYADAFRR